MAKKRRKWQRGRFSERREPIWDPLLELLPEDIEDFMWMGEAVLTDGTQIQFYKHYETRRYVLIDLGGRVWVQNGDDRYEAAEHPDWLLNLVFKFGDYRGVIVRRNEWIDSDEISWARSATKHRISRERSLHIVRNAGLCRVESNAEWEDGDSRLLFVGADLEGMPLEVVGADPGNGKSVIIHAMPLRKRYRGWYEEAREWEK
jgi:hypothetical protein